MSLQEDQNSEVTAQNVTEYTIIQQVPQDGTAVYPEVLAPVGDGTHTITVPQSLSDDMAIDPNIRQSVMQIVEQAMADSPQTMVQNVIFTVDPTQGHAILHNLNGDPSLLSSLQSSLVQGIDEATYNQLTQSAAGTDQVVHIQIESQNQENIPPDIKVEPKTEPGEIFEDPNPAQVGAARPGRRPGRPKLTVPDIGPPVGKGPYKCDNCSRIFKKWNQLQRHVRTHEEDKPFRCNDCFTTFNVEENLKLHLALHNTDDPSCPECGKKFTRVASLKAHLMMHEREESLMCSECGDEFGLQSQLNRHMEEHREEQEGKRKYPCKQCTLEFGKLHLLREHMKQHYKIKTSLSHKTYRRQIDRTRFPHKCIHCGKTFLKPSQLQRHIRIHTGEKPYKCQECDRAFNQKGALQIHMTKHTGNKPHMCDFCPKLFSQKGNLRAHIARVHTPGKDGVNTTYTCEECSCVYKKLGSLNAHMSKDHSEPQDLPSHIELNTKLKSEGGKAVNDVIQQLLQLSEQVSDNQGGITEVNTDILQQALTDSGLTADQVGKVTGAVNSGAATVSVSKSTNEDNETAMATLSIQDAATGQIKKHVIRKVNGIRWHQCTYCSKEFKKPSDLVRHIRIHTHEKPYKCSQCYRAFAVKSTLTGHFKTHTGHKEFKCDVCEKHFATQGSLKVHLRLHTGAKPFECSHCDKSFRTSGHRKNHEQSHFKEDSPKKPRRPVKRLSKPDIPLPDIPLQEPILITDTGLIQQAPRNSMYNQYLGEASSVDRPYKCAYCTRGFKKSSHLKQHVRSHTGEKPYKCLQCKRCFVSSGVLKAHIRTHSGLKAYKCLICDTTFTTNGSLKRHMSIHSEVRPFMCPYCQKTFKTSVNCKKHMKTHKHELAMQALQQQNPDQTVDPVIISSLQEDDESVPQPIQTQVVANSDGIIQSMEVQIQDTPGQPQQVIQEQPDLTLPQPEVQIQSGDLTAQGVITDSLNQNLEQQLQQTLNQQIFGNQQNLLGNQNFSQITYSQGQFTVQPGQLDVSSFTNGLSATSTPIPSASQTISLRESVELTNMTSAQRERQVVIQRETNEGKRAFKCKYCLKGFKKSSHLKQHIRSHTGEKPYKCHQCCRMFVSAGVLRAHQKTHTGLKEFQCDVCNAMFTTNGSLTRHMMTHTTQKPFKCPLCPEQFKTQLNCKRHIKLHKEISVSDAEEVINLDGDDVEEEPAVEPMEPEDLEPEDEEISQTEQSQRRVKSVIKITKEQAEKLSQTNPGPDMSVSEAILIQSASEKDRISEVKEDALDADKSPKYAHACDTCGKSFKKPSDLVRHIRIHTGEKPYQCSVCRRMFTVKSTLDCHFKTHQQADKSFKCHVCNSYFSTKGSLKVHMRLHTGSKPFKCKHCEQRFRTSGHRKSHMQSHFRPAVPKKRKPTTRSSSDRDTSNLQPINLLNQTPDPNPNIINIDNSLLQAPNVLPISLSVDSFSALNESGLAAQVLQGLEGIQLQLSGNLGQGIQISGLDPSILSQTVQIDASLLQQLQQQGNINLTINPALLNPGLQVADPNLIQNVQVQSTLADTVNPNVIVQPMSNLVQSETDMTEGEGGEVQAEIQQAQVTFDSTGPGGVDTEDVNSPLEQDVSMTEEHERIVHDIQVHSLDDSPKAKLLKAASADRLYVCEVCDKAFKRSSHLKDHLHIHTAMTTQAKQRIAQHKCETCDKSFTKPSQLERHVRIHTGERPFVCNICDKAFNQKNALQIHLKKHTGDKDHKCPYCTMAFIQKGNLKTHIKRAHHNDMVQSMNIPGKSEAMDSSALSTTTIVDVNVPMEDKALDLEGVVSELFDS